MVKLDEKDLYQLLVAELRYAVARDNDLAPSTCVQHITDYLPDMSASWRPYTAYQLTKELIDERVRNLLDQDAVWEKLMVFLTDYLEKLPSNIESYMQYLYNNPAIEASIDYLSSEIQDKLRVNLCE